MSEFCINACSIEHESVRFFWQIQVLIEHYSVFRKSYYSKLSTWYHICKNIELQFCELNLYIIYRYSVQLLVLLESIIQYTYIFIQQIHDHPVDYSAKAKPKIDNSDPNPGIHKLKHSLNDLVIPLGRALNPRFVATTGLTSKSSLVKSTSFHTAVDVDDHSNSTAKSSIVKSSTFDSVCAIESSATPNTSPESETVLVTKDSNPTESLSKAIPDSEDSENTSMAMEVCRETVRPQHKLAWGDDYTTNGEGHDDNSMMFDETLEICDTGKGVKSINGRTSGYSSRRAAFYEESVPTYHRDRKMNLFGKRRAFECPISAPTCEEDECEEEDMNIIDFEVTNSEKETTVVLKHLLALSSLREEENDITDSTTSGASMSTGSTTLHAMPSIEESDSEESENYYESEDIAATVTTPTPIVPYTLPVPTVNLVDEDGTVLETILQGREALSKKDTDTVDSDSYSPKTVYNESGPSTQL